MTPDNETITLFQFLKALWVPLTFMGYFLVVAIIGELRGWK